MVTASVKVDHVAHVSDVLNRVDWNFTNARTRGGVHGIHPYPAKFIPQIPRQLLQLIGPRPPAVVFDPFCGSGTTLVEAQLAGYRTIGVDLNPIATLISRVKTDCNSPPLSSAARRIVRAAKQSHVKIPPIPRIDHWFTTEAQRALAGLHDEVSRETSDSLREGLKLALSAITVRVSNQDGETRYAAVKKNVSEEQVFLFFQRAADKIDAARSYYQNQLFDTPRFSSRLLTADILSVTPKDIGPVDLVITSPPYPNAYEYWLYHKYRMYWLGFDPIAVRESEIGARPHFFKKNPHTSEDFQRQMGIVFKLLSSVMSTGSLACFVVADSMIRGEIVDNVKLLANAGNSNHFRVVTTISRDVPDTRKTFNPVNGRIVKESLVVFGRC